MEINKALELGLEWAEKRMASELTEMDKEYILTGIIASLVKNCSIPDVSGQSELLKKFWEYFDKESIAVNCNDEERSEVIKDFFNSH